MRFASAVGVALMALAIGACGGGDDESGGGGGEGGTIKVGAWFPLSGPVAASGIPQKEGANAYFEQANAAGGINGHKVEYTTEDNAFDPQQTIQAARKLVGDEKVVAIVAANGTATSAAAFPYVLNQAKVPIINTYGGAADWYDPPRASALRLPDPVRAAGRRSRRLGSGGRPQEHRRGPERSCCLRGRGEVRRAGREVGRPERERQRAGRQVPDERLQPDRRPAEEQESGRRGADPRLPRGSGVPQAGEAPGRRRPGLRLRADGRRGTHQARR